MEEVRGILQRVFGYGSFRGGQEAVIAAVMSGRDALVVMPTGGGKSLCYQLPALALPGTALVVSPLIALMQDQVSALRENGVNAAFLNSSQSQQEQRRVEDSFRAGALDLLYMAPERLVQPFTRDMLRGGNVCLIAIDEAHCVSAWGHDFRPEYLQLGELAEHFPGVRRLALTATADPLTRRDIVERLSLTQPEIFVCGFDRPNIRYLVEERDNPKKQLLSFLDRHEDECGIVYCSTRKETEETAAFLCAEGFTARAYHAGLPNEVRADALSAFQRAREMIVVATIAFGMGVDKPDVRFVAHMSLPKSVESYYQETGRAGRDGAPAEAWLIYGLKDLILQRRFIDEGEGSDEYKRVSREKLNTLLAFCESAACRRRLLLRYFGEDRADDCGNCDTCIAPPETFDATVAAQKALSNVYRTGGRFGVTHLVDVLLGRETERVQQFRHQNVSTFGIGSELDDSQWLALYRQLVVAGYCEIDVEHFNAVRLNDRSWAVLKDGEKFSARRLRKKTEKAKRKREKTTRAAAQPDLSPAQNDLFEKLRNLRLELARTHGVPPYVIFHDATLRELCLRLPRTMAEFLQIGGVGESKAARYGEHFLAALRSD